MHGRLVVTGHNSASSSVFVRDDKVEPLPMLGAGNLLLFWSADEAAVYPNPGENAGAPKFFPPVGGVRFFTMILAPRGGASSHESGRATSGEVGADLTEIMERDQPGMHTTDSTDFALVSSGRVELELDDGVKVVLSAGDAIVQNGTRHRWRVAGDEPAILTFVLVGARRPDLQLPSRSDNHS
jgi:quercetin dioxygenase-like cupin family protein